MKKYRVQRAAVIIAGCVCGFLQFFYYSILRICFPEFLRLHKPVADTISVIITLGLVASIYVFVTMILKANHQLWTLRQQIADCAYVHLAHTGAEPLTAQQCTENVIGRCKKDGWGQLEEVEFCGTAFQYLLIKGTGCVYLIQEEHLTLGQVEEAQQAILKNVEAIGLRKRQESVLCFCCGTADEDAKAAAKTCLRRGKTAVYTVILEASDSRGFCLLTNRKGKVQDNTCQKMLADFALGYSGGTVPDSARSSGKNPGAVQAQKELDEFELIRFWKSTR